MRVCVSVRGTCLVGDLSLCDSRRCYPASLLVIPTLYLRVTTKTLLHNYGSNTDRTEAPTIWASDRPTLFSSNSRVGHVRPTDPPGEGVRDADREINFGPPEIESSIEFDWQYSIINSQYTQITNINPFPYLILLNRIRISGEPV